MDTKTLPTPQDVTGYERGCALMPTYAEIPDEIAHEEEGSAR